MAKCPIDRGRPSPGMHGQRRGKKLSDYGVQLRSKQRLRRQYGMQEGQFRVFFERAARMKKLTGELLLQMLEARLDNILYRMGFASSRKAARMIVTHNHVLVDGHRAQIPSLVIKPGSMIQIKDRPKSRQLVTRHLESSQVAEVPVWLSVNAKDFSGQFVRIPTRDEIAPLVDEQLIVELYSK